MNVLAQKKTDTTLVFAYLQPLSKSLTEVMHHVRSWQIFFHKLTYSCTSKLAPCWLLGKLQVYVTSTLTSFSRNRCSVHIYCSEVYDTSTPEFHKDVVVHPFTSFSQTTQTECELSTRRCLHSILISF